MPTGVLDGGWAAAPTAIPGLGESQFSFELMDPVLSRPMVGGPQFPSDAGYDSTGFNRIATGYDVGGPPIPGTEKATTWRSALDWQHSPTAWILLFLLAAVGFISARVELGGRVGPARAHIGGGLY